MNQMIASIAILWFYTNQWYLLSEIKHVAIKVLAAVFSICIHFNRVLSFETAPVLTAFPDAMKADTLSFIANIGRYFSGALGEEIG